MPSEDRRVSGYVGCRPKSGRMAIFFILFCSLLMFSRCRPKFGRVALFSCVYLLNAELVFLVFGRAVRWSFVVYIVFYSLLTYLVS